MRAVVEYDAVDGLVSERILDLLGDPTIVNFPSLVKGVIFRGTVQIVVLDDRYE